MGAPTAVLHAFTGTDENPSIACATFPLHSQGTVDREASPGYCVRARNFEEQKDCLKSSSLPEPKANHPFVRDDPVFDLVEQEGEG